VSTFNQAKTREKKQNNKNETKQNKTKQNHQIKSNQIKAKRESESYDGSDGERCIECAIAGIPRLRDIGHWLRGVFDQHRLVRLEEGVPRHSTRLSVFRKEYLRVRSKTRGINARECQKKKKKRS
jgi:hypothetical protein